MPAGTWQVYHIARERLMDGTYDLDDNTFICALLDTAHTVDLATQAEITDVAADEITDTDYARVTLTSITWDETNGIVTFDSADIDFGTSVDIAARYAVIFNSSAADGLLCSVDLNTGGGNVSSSQSTFLIQIAATGIFTLDQV